MNRKGIKSIILFSALLITSCNGTISSSLNSSSISSEEIEVDAISQLYFDVNNAHTHEINPLIYGTFIEHIESCIYNGIWAEMILDRKFYQPIETDVSQWRKGGNKEVISIDDGTYSPGYAPKIKAGSSIFQRGLSFDAREYNGYFYALGIGRLEVVYENNHETITRDFVINETSYKKIDYTINSSYRDERTTITFNVLEGELIVDSVSLMPSDNYHGMRRDTLDLLKHLNAPLYRWPGGNFVSGYDFYDGIGPRDKRPTTRNLHYVGQLSNFTDEAERLANDIMKIGNLGFYGAFEPNDYGIDEFILMCRYLEAEPNLVLNSGLGTVEDAINEVEYVNGLSGEYAAKRPQVEPYNIKYIAIGNEMNGSWQLGNMPINDYIIKHNAIAAGIKLIDPNIVILGVGDNHSSWSRQMINGTIGNMDLISEHFYAQRIEENVSNHIESMKHQAEMRTNNHRLIMGNTGIKISFDEYAYLNANEASRLKDGMGVATALNVFQKNSDIIDIACYSSTVNATQGSLTTNDYAALMQGNGFVLSLYSRFMESHYLPLTFNKRYVDGYFEVSATISADRKTLTLSVINSSEQTVKLAHDTFRNVEQINYVTADYLESSNSEDKTELFEYELIDPGAALSMPRSVSIIKIKL